MVLETVEECAAARVRGKQIGADEERGNLLGGERLLNQTHPLNYKRPLFPPLPRRLQQRPHPLDLRVVLAHYVVWNSFQVYCLHDCIC